MCVCVHVVCLNMERLDGNQNGHHEIKTTRNDGGTNEWTNDQTKTNLPAK